MEQRGDVQCVDESRDLVAPEMAASIHFSSPRVLSGSNFNLAICQILIDRLTL